MRSRNWSSHRLLSHCSLSHPFPPPSLSAACPASSSSHLLFIQRCRAKSPAQQHQRSWVGQSIVGMWHVLFTAQTMNGSAIPDTVIDNALSVWHNDHTEIMNSVRPPQDGNFCLGVWQQTGKSSFYLNHFAWFANQFPNYTNNGIGDPVGPTRFTERVTVSPDGNHFTGTFTLTAYDTRGNVTITFTGALSGTRITTSTTTGDLLN